MNKKGLTLVEVILSIAILGLIAAAFLPMISYSFINLVKAKGLSEDLFDAQQTIEEEMEIARNTMTDVDDYSLTVFSKSIIGHPLYFDMQTKSFSSTGDINVFVPEYKIFYNVPEIESATLRAYRNGVLIANPSFLFPLDSTLTFRGTKVDGSQQDFLLNVYRFYMSPISVTPPANYREWIIIKEWNEAKTPLSYADSDDFAFIPNIELDYDSLNFTRDFGFSDDLTAIRYAGRYFVYSVTPYSKIGRIGEEIFSNAISTNRIDSIDPIYVTHEWIGADTYNINDGYSTLPANMIYGVPLDVDVVWNNPVIAIASPTQAEIIRNGTVVGYEDPVEFHFIVTDLVEELVPTSMTVSGPSRVNVPTSVTGNTTYQSTVYDQHGNPMSGQTVTWSLTNPGTGITINTATGVVSMTPAATNRTFVVNATLTANPAIHAEISVKAAKAYANNCTASATRTTREVIYSIYVRDDQSIGITGLNQSDILINYIIKTTSTYRTLTTIHNDSRCDVQSFIDYGDGHYTWTVYAAGFNTNSSSGGVRVTYASSPATNIAINRTGLTVRYIN